MNVVDVDLDSIDEDPGNPNRMTAEKFRGLVRAIEQLGFLQPVIVEHRPDGRYRMRDGHHRARALRELGRTTVPAVVVELGADAGAVAAIALALNNLRGEVDLTAAADLIGVLREAGWSAEDMLMTGFSEQELRDLVDAQREPSPDELLAAGAEEPEAEAEDGRGKLVLEVEFDDAETLRRVKRALRRAAGKGRPLSEGLVKALALEER